MIHLNFNHIPIAVFVINHYFIKFWFVKNLFQSFFNEVYLEAIKLKI